MKTKLLTSLFFVFLAVSHAGVPQLFRERSFSAANIAEAVNHFVALGEESAARELTDLAPDHHFERDNINKGFSLPERISWVCRILFQPKGNQPLRAPRYGGHKLPNLSMPLARWPLFPMAASGDSFFVLSEGYMLAGVPEDPRQYLAYCRAEGTFRKQPVLVPTRPKAERDVLALRQSPAWKAIKWKESGPGISYTMSEGWFWRFIQDQADAIK